MNTSDIAAVMAQIPTLTAHGIGIYERNLPAAQRRKKIVEGQVELLDSEEDCTKICEWLAAKSAIKTADKDSYWLKHQAEREIGYVTNGSFIAAAIHSGFPYRLAPGSTNVFFGISHRSLAASDAS